MKKHNVDPKDHYFRMRKELKRDFANNNISLLEFLLLVILHINANPHNGIAPSVSYSGLVPELHGQFSKNQINKAMLNLKRQKYIWYPNQQGSRSTFEVEINKYPLAENRFKDIEYRFKQGKDKSMSQSAEEFNEEVDAKEGFSNQKFDQHSNAYIEATNNDSSDSNGRSTKNEKETKIKNENEYISHFSKGKFLPILYMAKDDDEQFVKEVAIRIGENRISFLLSVLRDYGVGIIQNAFEIFEQRNGYEKSNPPAYFNKIISGLKKSEKYSL